jgi:hypothetical protein
LTTSKLDPVRRGHGHDDSMRCCLLQRDASAGEFASCGRTGVTPSPAHTRISNKFGIPVVTKSPYSHWQTMNPLGSRPDAFEGHRIKREKEREPFRAARGKPSSRTRKRRSGL